MLTIREIEANEEGKRQFEITDMDRTSEINPEKQNKNTKNMNQNTKKTQSSTQNIIMKKLEYHHLAQII